MKMKKLGGSKNLMENTRKVCENSEEIFGK